MPTVPRGSNRSVVSASPPPASAPAPAPTAKPDWHHVRSECLTLPRIKALEFAAKHKGLPVSPVEREVDPSRVKKLEAILRKDVALPFNWATAEWDGYIIRMNGQHSSQAIVNLGAELPEQLSFHLDHFKAGSRVGLVDLFRQFDQRWSMRTVQDISGAYQGTTPELAAFDRKPVMMAARGVSWQLRTVESVLAPSGDDIYSILHNTKEQGVLWVTPFITWYCGIFNGRKELLKPEVIAGMYKTHELSESGASIFWREVSFGVDHFTDDSMPGAVLIAELYKALEDKEYREKEFPQPATYYRKCIKAWNAFCAGQRISTLKIGKEKGWPEVSGYRDEEAMAS